MLFQQVSIAILGLAIATEAAIIPEFDGLGQIGLVRRQNNRFGGGANRGGNNQAKASTTAKAAAATSAAATNNNGGNNNNNAGGNAGAATGATCLDASVVQANSDKVS